MPPAIVVMPQGLNQNRWMDYRDGTKPMESIITKNLIPHIDATVTEPLRRVRGAPSRVIRWAALVRCTTASRIRTCSLR